VQASQTFERGAKRAKRVAVAGRERDFTVKDFAVRRAEILAATAAAYVHALAAQQRLTLAAEPLRLARETLALIESRARAGAASAIESARARAAVISAEAEFTRTESAFVSARAALAATWAADLAAVPSSALPGTLLLPSTPTAPLPPLWTHLTSQPASFPSQLSPPPLTWTQLTPSIVSLSAFPRTTSLYL
jgi:cobalt-zinc-cadmium efflux system outer membrane protein